MRVGSAGDNNAEIGFRKPRRRMVIVVIAACVVAALLLSGGWWAATLFESPAQREAAAEPPVPAAVTATVVKGSLVQTVSTRLTISREADDQVTVPSQGDVSVVTGTPLSAGDQVDSGTQALEVDGRPVFVIAGAFVLYRDMSPGMSGPDVSELQTALVQAGLSLSVDGKFGASTDSAVRKLYARAGYQPITQAASETTAMSGNSSASAGSTDTSTSGTSSGSTGTDTTAGQPAPAAVPPPVLVVPRSEFVVVSQLPAYVSSQPSVGTLVSDSTQMSFARGGMVGVAGVPASTAVQLKQGMSVDIRGNDGRRVSGMVASITPPSTSSQTSGGSSGGSSGLGGTGSVQGSGQVQGSSNGGDTQLVVTAADGATIPDSWLGANVLALVSVQVAAEDSLLVPAVAVVSAGSGNPYVYKRQRNGVFIDVPVKQTATMDGRAAVTPLQPGGLRVGDIVKVG